MQTIDITTAQNVTIEYELASVRERGMAMFIDILIECFLWLALILLTISSRSGLQSSFWTQFVFSFPFWFTIMYALLCESFLNGQTFGKRSQRIRVVRVDGRPIHLSDLLLRAVLLLVDLLMSVGALGGLLIFTTERRQRLGDMAAGTTVIKLSSERTFTLSDILNIQTLQSHTPQYPQVRSLSEDDMLFIKSVVQRYQLYPNDASNEAVWTLYEHLSNVLDVSLSLKSTESVLNFFKTLIKDYIVLTR